VSNAASCDGPTAATDTPHTALIPYAYALTTHGVYVYLRVCVCVCVTVCVHVTCVRVSVCLPVCLSVSACLSVCMHACMHVCVCVAARMYTYQDWAAVGASALDNGASLADRNSLNGHMAWHDSFYLLLSTITTVGYGDVHAQTLPGRVVVICLLLAAIVLVPKSLHWLLTELHATTPYQRARFVPNNVSQEMH